MAKRKTHEEFVKELKLINPNIKVLSNYHSANEKIHCKCIIDEYDWYATPNKLLHNRGCPKCKSKKLSDSFKKPKDVFIKQIHKVNPNIEIIGEYVNNHTKIKCRCIIDNYIWYPVPNSILRGIGCPKCGNVERISHEDFVDKLNKVNDSIEILENYNGMTNKLLCQCRKCSHEWSARPVDLLHGSGCPKCALSKGEIRIEKLLSKYNINYVSQKRFDDLIGIGGGYLSYDFYLPTCNMLIEYQGQFHDGTTTGKLQSKLQLDKQKDHDHRKREYANQHNIDLLEIWYWDYNNIEQILNEKLHINNNEKSA